MPLIRRLMALLAVVLFAGCAAPRPYQFDFATMPDFRWDRITSVDPTGGNADNVRLQPGEALEMPLIEGPGEITRIWLTFTRFTKSHQQLVMEITWDDAPGPSVRAPLGTFFAIGDKPDTQVETDFLHVAGVESLNSFFPMPFRRSARIRIINESPNIVAAFYYIVEFKRFDSPAAMRDKLYFHAHYRQETPATNRENYLLLDTPGPGVFLGTSLSIGLNSYGWWGEGDDIFIVDGVRTKGTGSEDYYGGAWGWAFQPARGTRFGVPIADRALEPGGFWSVYRFHSEAPVRFDRHFRFEIEHGIDGYNGREPIPNNYYSVAYYYLAKPQVQPPLPPAEERINRTLPQPVHKPGEWLELESLHARALIGSTNGGAFSVRSPRAEMAWSLSGKAELLLTAYHSGVHFFMPIHFPAENPRHAEVRDWQPTLRLTKEPQGLEFDLFLNGEVWQRGLSAYAPQREVHEIELPPVRLADGVAMVEVVIAGVAPEAVEPAFFVGLDAIRFEPLADPDRKIDFYQATARELPEAEDFLRLAREGNSVLDLGWGGPRPVILQGDTTLRSADSLALHFQGGQSRAMIEDFAAESPGRHFEIDVLVTPDRQMGAQRGALFSKNLVMGAWLRNGAACFWVRDSTFRYLYLETPANIVPFDVPTRLRFTLHDTVARIYVNGALARELDMRQFDPVNVYPGRWNIGNVEELNAPFVGTIEELTIRRLP